MKQSEKGYSICIVGCGRKQLSWKGHFQRLGEGTPVKKILNARFKNRRGRLNLTWNRNVKKIL